MLHVVTFKWNSDYKIKYSALHVNILEAMIRRHYKGDFRFVCVTDDPTGIKGETYPLWTDCGSLRNASGSHLPSCYRRLKLFDPATQEAMGVRQGDRLVSIDLDMVICGDLAPLWDRDEPFIGWAVKGSHHQRVFNGSMWLLQAGEESHVWEKFSPDVSPAEAKEAGYLGSDQAWMSYRLKGRAGWTEADGVYSYPRSLHRMTALPGNMRVAVFHGFQKPWMVHRMPQWVRASYRQTGSGRCLVLGYGPQVWNDAMKAKGPFDGVIASPEAAEQWPRPVTAIAETNSQVAELMPLLGFDQAVYCGLEGTDT